ncbi:MAG: TIGR01440 family protein [Firmicutes bacterium]|nr:TIGR01440 family protein [Candidatus Colimorpha enterica]
MAGTVHEIEDKKLVNKIRNDALKAVKELVDAAGLKKGDILVVGCSTSETLGEKVGSYSVPEVGEAICDGILSVLSPLGIFLAAQCCEHLNRAIIIERAAVPGQEIVNVVPQPKAGGSFATACYGRFSDPVAVEEIKADAGIDIGGTLIGMHLKKVAVPVRLGVKKIGKAPIICARTRPKFIGGERAHYDERMK